jgi:hypothetical protein
MAILIIFITHIFVLCIQGGILFPTVTAEDVVTTPPHRSNCSPLQLFIRSLSICIWEVWIS